MMPEEDKITAKAILNYLKPDITTSRLSDPDDCIKFTFILSYDAQTGLYRCFPPGTLNRAKDPHDDGSGGSGAGSALQPLTLPSVPAEIDFGSWETESMPGRLYFEPALTLDPSMSIPLIHAEYLGVETCHAASTMEEIGMPRGGGLPLQVAPSDMPRTAKVSFLVLNSGYA